MKKLSFLEALRGYAILGVLFTHSAQKMMGLPTWLYNLGIQGARGVQLFFIVSAFTLFYSLSKKYETNQFDIKDFFIRRFFRIAPAFYFAFVFYTVFDLITYYVGLKDYKSEYSLGLIFSTLSFTNLINPNWLFSLVPGGWSISAEMLFYLFVPIFFFLIKNIKQAILLSITTFLLGLFSNITVMQFSLISARHISDRYLFYWFPNQISIFCLGIVLFFIWKKQSDNQVFISKTTNNIFLGLSIISIMILGVTGNIYNPYLPKHFLFGLAFSFCTFSLANFKNHVLVNNPIIFIGKISFSMYLVHFFVLDILKALLVTKLLTIMPIYAVLSILFILTLSISIIISYMSYKFIETPGINLGRKLTQLIKDKKEFDKISSKVGNS